MNAASRTNLKSLRVIRMVSAVALLAIIVAGTCEATTRVALVSTCGGDAGADVLALAEAKLSQQPDIELVDRHEIERVLQEQKLWTCGRSGAGQAVAAGKLLGVEVFAALEIFPDSQRALGLVVFDAVNGVRLGDRALPEERLDDTITGIINAVRNSCEKRLDKGAKLRTVCLMSVRNADLPRELDSFCDASGRLWERELVMSQDLAILDRRQLEQVNRERELPGASSSNSLLAALLIVNIEVGRLPKGGGYRATAFVTTSSGVAIQRCDANTTNLDAVTLAHDLVQETTKVLHAAATEGKIDRVAEAKRFFREAEWAEGHEERIGQVKAAEAAWALEPDNILYMMALSKALLGQGLVTINPSASPVMLKHPSDEAIHRSLELVQRGTQLRRDALQTYSIQESNGLTTADIKSIPNWPFDRGDTEFDRYAMLILSLYRPSDGKCSPFWGAVPIFVHTRQYFRTGNFSVIDEAIASCHAGWRTSEIDQLLRSSLTNYYEYEQAKQRRRTPPAHTLNPVTTVEVARLKKMADQLKSDCISKHPSADEVRQRVQEIVLAEEADLSNPQMAAGEPERLALDEATEAAIYCLSASHLTDDFNRRITDLNSAMLDRGDIGCSILHHPFAIMWRGKLMVGSGSIEADRRRLEFYNRALVVLNTPAHRELSCLYPIAANNSPSLRKVFLHFRHLILSAHPEWGLKTVTPWTQAQLVVEAFDNSAGMQRLLVPMVDDRFLYVLGSSETNGITTLQLVCKELPDGPLKFLGKVQFAKILDVTAACISGKRYYVATKESGYHAAAKGVGLIGFSTANANVTQITTTNGLPCDSISALAACDNILFAAVNEPKIGFALVSYDTTLQKCEILASSRRTEKHSRFDNCLPVQLLYTTSDPDRHRIIFAALQTANEPRAWWEWNTQSRQFRELTSLSNAFPFVSGSRAAGDRVVISEKRMVNLQTDSVESLIATNNPADPVGSPTTNDVMIPCPPYLFLDNWIWSGTPFGRISLDGKVQELFALPRKAGSASCSFIPPESLQVVGQGKQILAATPYEIWLLTLPSN